MKEINPKSAGEIRICSTKDKPKSNEGYRGARQLSTERMNERTKRSNEQTNRRRSLSALSLPTFTAPHTDSLSTKRTFLFSEKHTQIQL